MEEEIKEYIPETIPEFELSNDSIPGLTEDKLDASISIRGLVGQKVYTGMATVTSTANITINVGFQPKSIYIEAFFVTPDRILSKSWAVLNPDNSITVTTTYKSSNIVSTLGSGDSGTIDMVYLATSSNTANIISIDNTGFTLGNITRNNNYYLQIEVLG